MMTIILDRLMSERFPHEAACRFGPSIRWLAHNHSLKLEIHASESPSLSPRPANWRTITIECRRFKLHNQEFKQNVRNMLNLWFCGTYTVFVQYSLQCLMKLLKWLLHEIELSDIAPILSGHATLVLPGNSALICRAPETKFVLWFHLRIVK
jgi:hypothetical protein